MYCHRADLVQHISRCIPADQIHLDKSLDRIEQNEDSVTAFFTDGTSETAQALIGADGIRSKTRQTWNEEKPLFTDRVVVRQLTKIALLNERVQEMCRYGNVWPAPGNRHVVAYPIQQGQTLCVGAVIPAIGDKNWEESWKVRENELDWNKDFLPIMEDFDPGVQDMFKLGHSPTIFGLYERDPLPSWKNGRVILIGDASHAMRPHQGT